MTTKRAWIYTAILGQALTFGTATAQSTVNRDRPRSSYDPGAVGSAKKKPIGVETALGKLNPENKDYASAIDTVRVAAIEETFDNYLWWMSACELFLISLGAVYIYWLWEERDSRLSISADIVAQLWNAHSGSRGKAIESIEMYNTLMRRFNAQTVELRAARAAAEAVAKEGKKKKDTQDPADKIKTAPAAGPSVEKNQQLSLPVVNNEQPSQLHEEKGAAATVTIAPSAPSACPDELLHATTDLKEDKQENEAEDEDEDHDEDEEQQEMKRFKAEIEKVLLENSQMKAQAGAQNQKISQLRTQLNRAHDQYKVQPQQGADR